MQKSYKSSNTINNHNKQNKKSRIKTFNIKIHPPIKQNDKCIRAPQQNSKNVIIISLSSNDHSIGEIAPKSNAQHDIANKPLKHLVNSKNITLIADVRKVIDNLNKFSNANTNKCSLHTTLT